MSKIDKDNIINDIIKRSNVWSDKRQLAYMILSNFEDLEEKVEFLETQNRILQSQFNDASDNYARCISEKRKLEEDANKWRKYKELNKPLRYCKKCERIIPENNPSDFCGPCYEYDRLINS